MLSDNWYPGWKAKVDGQDGRRAGRLRDPRAVAGRGRHRVEYYYQPASWRIGWIISLLALLGSGGGRRLRAGGAAGDQARPPDLVAALLSLALAAVHGGPRARARPGALERGYLVVLNAVDRWRPPA